MASTLSSFRQVDHPLSESAFPMKLLQKPASSDMVFLDTDFHNASLPATDYRVRPPYLSFHADIFRTQATPDIHLTGAIFQTRSPPSDLPWQTDSTDADFIMASISEVKGSSLVYLFKKLYLFLASLVKTVSGIYPLYIDSIYKILSLDTPYALL